VVSFVTIREIEISTPTVTGPSACGETAEANDIGCVAELVMTGLAGPRPDKYLINHLHVTQRRQSTFFATAWLIDYFLLLINFALTWQSLDQESSSLKV
jgi:hypothetical protein